MTRRPRVRRQLVGLLIVVVITVVCLAWVVSGIEPRQALSALRATPVLALVPTLLLLTGVVLFRTWRYQVLLREQVGFSTMLSVIGVTFMAINVVPLRMGELVRPYLLVQHADVPLGSAVAAVVLERLLDMGALFLLLLLAAVLVDLPPGGLVVGGVDLLTAGQRTFGLLLLTGAVASLLLAAFGDRALDALLRPIRRLLPAAADRVEVTGRAFITGLRHLARQPLRGVVGCLHTLAIWGLNGAAVWVMLDAFAGLEAGWEVVLVNYAGTAIAVALLPTPGFFGAFEMGSTATLRLLGADPTLAGTFSLLMHLIIFLHLMAVGLACVVARGWSLSQLLVPTSATPGVDRESRS